MYVVLRQADVGEVDTLAVFEDEIEADELALLVNARDGSAYYSWVEFTPLYRAASVNDAFRDLFGDERIESDAP